MEQTLYDYLRGNWSVKRRIEDLLAKQDNWFTGEAQFVGSGVELNYAEAGLKQNRPINGTAKPMAPRSTSILIVNSIAS